ncbi:hypothetical protein ACVIGB_010058 [Bradyrhizobium sp. USDA 4341]
MSDAHTRDPSWKTDLIWHYFHSVTTAAKAPAAYRKFYSNQDPGDELDNRHRVYEMLVDEPLNTRPVLLATADESMENYKKSKLPWNQNNAGFLKAVSNEYWCGSILKIVFVRYMGWKMVEPTARDQVSAGRDPGKAVDWTIKNLENKVPVRASLGGAHYVGIVGHRTAGADDKVTEFLCLDPWAYGIDGGNMDMKYAGTKTAFLGISKRDGAIWTYSNKAVAFVERPS